jgi:hypothetical protein
MDFVGDADELYDDEQVAPSDPWLTAEARVLTGAGLLLLGLLGNTLFQILTFLLGNNDGSQSRWMQWTIYAGPAGVLGVIAAVLAAPVRRHTDSRMLQGGAVAVLVVGLVLALLVAGGYLIIATSDDNRF